MTVQVLGRIEREPTHPVGMACPECERPYGLSHLGSCSGSTMRGGCGIVGFRDAHVVEAERV